MSSICTSTTTGSIYVSFHEQDRFYGHVGAVHHEQDLGAHDSEQDLDPVGRASREREQQQVLRSTKRAVRTSPTRRARMAARIGCPGILQELDRGQGGAQLARRIQG